MNKIANNTEYAKVIYLKSENVRNPKIVRKLAIIKELANTMRVICTVSLRSFQLLKILFHFPSDIKCKGLEFTNKAFPNYCFNITYKGKKKKNHFLYLRINSLCLNIPCSVITPVIKSKGVISKA